MSSENYQEEVLLANGSSDPTKPMPDLDGNSAEYSPENPLAQIEQKILEYGLDETESELMYQAAVAVGLNEEMYDGLAQVIEEADTDINGLHLRKEHVPDTIDIELDSDTRGPEEAKAVMKSLQ